MNKSSSDPSYPIEKHLINKIHPVFHVSTGAKGLRKRIRCLLAFQIVCIGKALPWCGAIACPHSY
jgi:hypothetical protein